MHIPTLAARAFLAGASLFIAATSASAQDASTGNVVAIPPGGQQDAAPERTVGPDSLRDFSLDPADRQPQAPVAAPGPDGSQAQPQRAPQRQPRPAPTRPPAPQQPQVQPSTVTPSTPVTSPPPPQAPVTSPAVPSPGDLPPTGATPSPLEDTPQVEFPPLGDLDPSATEGAAADDDAGAIVPRGFDPTAEAGDGSGWGLLALMAAMVAATLLSFVAIARRRKRRPAPAAAAPAPVPPVVPKPQPETPPAPQPEPAAEPGISGHITTTLGRTAATAAAPASAPPPEPAVPSGLVSTSLKPDLVVEVLPVRCALDENELWVDYRIDVVNRGSAAAHNIRFDVAMINAGPEQAAMVEEFGAHPQPFDGPATIPLLSPGQGRSLGGRAALPLKDAQVFMIDERPLMMPVLLIALRRTAGPDGALVRGEKAFAYMVGRQGGSEGRLAPIRADVRPKLIRDVALKRA